MFSRLTGMTVNCMLNKTEQIILKIGGQQKELTLRHVGFIMGFGWMFLILAVVSHLLYYAVYPSEVEFEFKGKLKIFVLGTQRDLLNLLRCKCSCTSCSSCSTCCQCEEGKDVKSSDEEQIALQ